VVAHVDNASAAKGTDLDVAGFDVNALTPFPVQPLAPDPPLQPIGKQRSVDPRQNRGNRLVIRAGHDAAVKRHFVREVDKRLLQLGEASVTLHVLAVDVRHDGNRRIEHQERAIAFIRFRNQVLAAAEPRIAAEGAQSGRR
jgi:hypothetical protein